MLRRPPIINVLDMVEKGIKNNFNHIKKAKPNRNTSWGAEGPEAAADAPLCASPASRP